LNNPGKIYWSNRFGRINYLPWITNTLKVVDRDNIWKLENEKDFNCLYNRTDNRFILVVFRKEK